MDRRTDRRVCVRVELKKLTEILLVFAQAQAKVNLKYLTTSVDQKSPTLQGRGRGKKVGGGICIGILPAPQTLFWREETDLVQRARRTNQAKGN